MANHQIPRKARITEELTGRAAGGRTVKVRVYRHVREGHVHPMFYVLQYALRDDGRIDRSTRVTREFTGPAAGDRLEAEMKEVRELLAASLG